MITPYNFTVTERFLRYVQIDTQSDPAATCFPSTAKQLKLAELLVQELQAMGLTDAYSDTNGYTYATTNGGGVERFMIDVDGISGATVFDSEWSGLESDIINTVFIFYFN